LIAIRIVIADPLDDASAFWLTRPISRGALFAAKFTLISAIFLGLPALGWMLVAAASGTEWLLLPRLAIEWTALTALVLWPVMLLAAVTKDVARLVIACVVAMFVFIVLRFAQQPSSQNVTVAWAVGLATLVGLIAHQYLTGRRLRTLALVGVSVGVVALVLTLWPKRTIGGLVPASVAPATLGLRPISVSVTQVETWATIEGTEDPNRHVARIDGSFEYAGLPPNWVLRPLKSRGTFQAEGERPVRTEWPSDRWRNRFGWVPAEPFWGWAGAVAAAANTAIDFEGRSRRDRVLELPLETFYRQAGRVGRYEAEVEAAAFELHEAATMPFRTGAGVTVGNEQYTLVAVTAMSNGDRQVTIRLSSPRFVLPWRPPENSVLLRNRQLRHGVVFFAWAQDVPGFGLAGSAVDVSTMTFIEPVRSAARRLAPTKEFLDDAEVVVVRAFDRGRMTLHVSDDALQLPSQIR